jgi:hypothetical protein
LGWRQFAKRAVSPRPPAGFVVMAANPVEVIDGLVKGLVLALYDFLELTWVGLTLPFVVGTRRLWPAVIAADKRLSSLSFLTIWVLLALTMASDQITNLAASALTERHSDSTTVLIVSALLTTTTIDLAIRASFFGIRDRERRAVYEPIVRIAVANIMLGICLILVVRLLWLPNIMAGPAITFHGAPVLYPSRFLLPFAVALGVVVDKAFQLRAWTVRALVGAAVVFLAPAAFMTAGFNIYLRTGYVWFRVIDAPTLSQQFTRCTFQNGQVSVSGLLSVSHSKPLALDANDLAVVFEKRYLGRGMPGQAPIVISNSTFTPYSFVTKFDPEDNANAVPPSVFDCELKLPQRLFDDSSEVDGLGTRR